jgi:hypothetical protein
MRSLGLALLTATAVAALPASAAAQSTQPKLPVVAIDAHKRIVDDPKGPATMDVYDSRRRHVFNGPIAIELRGYSSQQEDPKKSYDFETQKPSGDNRNVSLLGMPADDDWVLIAAYRDESLLRNHLAYGTARWLGRYAPRTRFVELLVERDYEGVYMLAEDLKVHDSRVALDDSDVSGGYLLEMISMRRTPGEQYFTTPVEDLPIVFDDPNRDDLSFGRVDWIRDYVNRFESTLYSKRFRNRRRGYRRYLNVSAAVDYVLLNELFRNADAFENSTYMHKSVGGKLVLGPLWDFDHAIGNDMGDDNLLDGWAYAKSPWAERLYADPWFRERMAKRWQRLRKRGLKSHLMQTIDDGAQQLAGAQQRNFTRWPVFEKGLARPRDPRTGAPPASYAEAVDYLKWWLKGRLKWIDRNI